LKHKNAANKKQYIRKIWLLARKYNSNKNNSLIRECGIRTESI